MALSLSKRKKQMSLMRKQRYTFSEIGRKFGISKQRVCQILRGQKKGDKNPPNQKVRPSYEPPEEYKVDPLLENLVGGKFANITKLTKMKTGSRDRIRELVRIRDKHTCQLCWRKWKKGEKRFDVHHEDEELEGANNRGMSVTDQDRANTHRMVTLCHKCHLNLDSVRKKMSGGKRCITFQKSPENKGILPY